MAKEVAIIAKVFKRSFRTLLQSRAGVPNVVITVEPPTKGIVLTALTMEELQVLRDFFMASFDLAEPIVAELDLQAQEAYEIGGDDFERLYRATPVFVVRTRAFSEHRPGLQSGPEWLERLLGKITSPLMRLVGVGKPGSSLHHGAPEDLETEDDESEADSDPELGQGEWED